MLSIRGINDVKFIGMKKLLFPTLLFAVFSIISCKKSEPVQAEIPVATPTEQVSSGYKIGDIATDFSLKNVDDKMVSLVDFADAKGFIVIFTCNHCPYAVAYEDRIIALNEKYKPLGYPVIAINPNDPEKQPEDSFELMKARVKEKNITYPYLMDEGQKIFPQYGATKTPHVFVLQKTDQGNKVMYIGAVDDNYEEATKVEHKYVEEAVDALLAGQEITTKETKAIGCSIKVK